MTGQKSADGPKQKERVSEKQVLAAFLFTSRITKPSETVNKELIAEIAERKVDFVLDDQLSERIRKAGGSDELLTAIDGSLTKEQKARLIEFSRLEMIVRSIYARTVTLPEAIKAGRELIDNYSDEHGCTEFFVWLRKQLPQWHSRIYHSKPPSELDTICPKS